LDSKLETKKLAGHVKEKEQMATAVTAGNAPEEAKSSKQSVEAAVPRGGFQVHKPGEGYATRLGMMIVVLGFVAFACHHWYYNWVFVRDFPDAIGLGFMTSWMTGKFWPKVIGGGGTALVALTGFLVGYYFIYVKRASAEFLIKTDAELARVTWPKIVPWFKADTQVWGATYVVLIVIAGMTLYVFGVDMVLQNLAKVVFYGKGS